MSAAATLTPPRLSPTRPVSAKPAQPKRLISLEKFLERYTSREDPFKYEWNNGIVEKSPRTMNRSQFLLLQKLMRLFVGTKDFSNGNMLTSEVDIYLPLANRTRRADIAYLTAEQMKSSRNGELSVCPFVIEVISKNDQINEVGQKIREYFENGVQVVWTVFPRLQKVEVYRSVRDVTICFDDDVCSAAPVLPDFEISVRELFA
ncbi:MAG: Uma2 family endonuclease [Saprospiraceae bacterium]